VIDLCRCREILGSSCQLTDEQLELLRDDLMALANIALDVELREPRLGAQTVFEMAASLLPDEEREEIRERASILEFDGGLARTQAEEDALRIWATGRRNNRIN
jgi:hypothetical protein